MDVVYRPALDGARVQQSNVAFDGYVRSGATLEMKAFTGVTGDAGGYAVPREIDAVIDRALTAASPIRSVANVVRVGTAGYRKLVTTGGTPSGWAAETAARPETASPVFIEIVPPMGELYANPSASQAMLDDALFDVEEWLANEIAAEFAKAEGTAFVAGSGNNRPKGFLANATSAAGDATRPLLLSLDGGASWTGAGSTALPATMGVLASVPAAAPATLIDAFGTVLVDLARADMVLGDADDRRLDAGANLALVGDELIQFGRAEPLGGSRWRLSRLLRGRRGSEAAAGAQRPGDRFVLIEADSVATLDLPLATLGSEVRVMATGLGDDGDGQTGPAEVRIVIGGASVLPPAPAQLTCARLADGRARIAWVRRSRAGWRWTDRVDAPLGEEREAYRVTLIRADARKSDVETGVPSIEIPAGPPGEALVAIEVRQRGTFGESPAATIILERMTA
jgi:hypothetical protein